MKDTIKELKQIRKDLLFAVEYRDGLLVKFQVNKIDSLIYRLSQKLNGDIRESGVSICGLGVNPYCSDRAKDGTCLHDGICKHKQIDMERT